MFCTRDDPEEFMRSLHKHYSGTYSRASKAVESNRDEEYSPADEEQAHESVDAPR